MTSGKYKETPYDVTPDFASVILGSKTSGAIHAAILYRHPVRVAVVPRYYEIASAHSATVAEPA